MSKRDTQHKAAKRGKPEKEAKAAVPKPKRARDHHEASVDYKGERRTLWSLRK